MARQIDEATARGIASEWHGGQSSCLYAFSSSGTLQDGIEGEIEACLKMARTPEQQDELRNLQGYAIANRTTTIDEVDVRHADVAFQLLALSEQPMDETIEDEEGERSMDVRLQVVDGSWTLNTGDASYDTDHRGYWGSGSITPDMSPEAARELADSLICEAAEASELE